MTICGPTLFTETYLPISPTGASPTLFFLFLEFSKLKILFYIII